MCLGLGPGTAQFGMFLKAPEWTGPSVSSSTKLSKRTATRLLRKSWPERNFSIRCRLWTIGSIRSVLFELIFHVWQWAETNLLLLQTEQYQRQTQQLERKIEEQAKTISHLKAELSSLRKHASGWKCDLSLHLQN